MTDEEYPWKSTTISTHQTVTLDMIHKAIDQAIKGNTIENELALKAMFDAMWAKYNERLKKHGEGGK